MGHDAIWWIQFISLLVWPLLGPWLMFVGWWMGRRSTGKQEPMPRAVIRKARKGVGDEEEYDPFREALKDRPPAEEEKRVETVRSKE